MGHDTRIKRVKKEVRKFCMNMSAHGVPRVAMSEHYCVKLTWCLVIFSCLASFSYHANQIIAKFKRYEKIVNIAMQFENIPFPSVTICNTNPYKQTAALEVPELRRTVQLHHPPQYSSFLSHITRAILTQMTVFEQAANDIKNNATGSRSKRAYPSTRYIPGLSGCDCPKKRAECFRRDGTPPNGIALCVCFYDQISRVPWPCYEKAAWTMRACSACSSRTGTCPYPANGAGSASSTHSCLCQDISNYCIAVNRTKANSTVDDLVVNLWELTTTIAPPPSATELSEYVEALGFQDISDSGSLMSKGKENVAFVAATLEESVRVNISYQYGELIKICSFNGRECNIQKDFSLHIDATYGNCFTYNRYSNKTSSRSGPAYGLKVTAYLNPDDYLQVTEAAGVRLLVHDHDEYPFPDTFGYNAAPGQLTSFGLQMKRIRRLGPPYGDCISDQEGKDNGYMYSNYSYSMEGCYRSCLQRFLIDECGCGDPRYPTPVDIPHCAVSDGIRRICIDGAFADLYASREFLNCPVCSQPCYQTEYSISISSARWPVSIYQLPKDCTQDVNGCLDEYRQNGAMIEVYYERISHELLVESQAFGWASLMADFGGQLGLWLGASVITLTELIVLIWNVCIIAFADRNCSRGAEAIPTEDPNETSHGLRAEKRDTNQGYDKSCGCDGNVGRKRDRQTNG